MRSALCLFFCLLSLPAFAQEVEVIEVAPPPKVETKAAPQPAQPQPQPETQAEEAEETEEEGSSMNIVVLQGLNKVTGRISRLEGPVGTVLSFDNLEIITRRCWKAAPEERPENAALLEIRELKKDEEPKRVFQGWMFSSSPGLSGMEHPVYDVTAVSCESTPEPAAAEEQPKPAPKPEQKPVKKKPAQQPAPAKKP